MGPLADNFEQPTRQQDDPAGVDHAARARQHFLCDRSVGPVAITSPVEPVPIASPAKSIESVASPARSETVAAGNAGGAALAIEDTAEAEAEAEAGGNANGAEAANVKVPLE